MSSLLLAGLLLPGSCALRVATTPRASTISMGLAVGDTFPTAAAKKCGVAGRKAVVFFYGADDAPSCSKQIAAFESAQDEFAGSNVAVVGVRNGAGVKESTDASVALVVDEDDAMRNEIGIEKDLFGLLGGRETYVLDASGTVAAVHNNQFDPESHVKVALAAAEELPDPKSPIDEFIAQIQGALNIGA